MERTLIEALRRAKYMYLTTYGPNGQPGTVVTWLWFDDGVVHFTTRRESLKACRIRATGRVTVHVGTADGPTKNSVLIRVTPRAVPGSPA